jgi:hypothetical protein
MDKKCNDCNGYKSFYDLDKCLECTDDDKITIEINAYSYHSDPLICSELFIAEVTEDNWSNFYEYKNDSPNWIRGISRYDRDYIDIEVNMNVHSGYYDSSNQSFKSATQAEVEKMKRILTQ